MPFVDSSNDACGGCCIAAAGCIAAAPPGVEVVDGPSAVALHCGTGALSGASEGDSGGTAVAFVMGGLAVEKEED